MSSGFFNFDAFANIIAAINDFRNYQNDSNSGTSSNAAAQADLGSFVSDGSSLFNYANALINDISASNLPAMVGAAAAGSSAQLAAQQALAQMNALQATPGYQLDPAAYQSQMQGFQDTIVNKEGTLIQNAGILLTAFNPIVGLPLTYLGLLMQSEGDHDPLDGLTHLLQMLNVLSSSNNDDDDPPFSQGGARVADDFEQAEYGSGRDPLLVDVGNGVQTGNPSDGIYFNLGNDGVKIETSWATDTTGILVLDDGTPITSGAQLFGDATSLPDRSLAQTGFQALAALDSNGDGVIDANDAAYSSLGVWVDANQNGVADPGEVKTLAQIGIASINLNASATYVRLGGGSAETAQATVQWVDGHTSTIAEVGLADQAFYSTFTTPVQVSATAAQLPFVAGSGQVRDTQQAATLSSDFAQYLQAYSAATTRSQQVAMLPALLDKWASTSDFKSLMQSNTFATDSDNYQYTFAGVQQYTWQSGPDDTSLTAAPGTGPYGISLADAGGVYIGPEWDVGYDETPEYNKWTDMVSVLEIFNGQTLASESSFLADSTNPTSQISFAGNVVSDATSPDANILLPGGSPVYKSQYDNGGDISGSYGGAGDLSEAVGPPGAGWEPYIASARLWDISISQRQMAYLQDAYTALEKSVYGNLLLQTRLAQYVDAVTTSTTADGTEVYDPSGINRVLDANLAVDPINATIDLVELVQYNSATLNSIGYDWATKLNSVVEQSQANGTWDSVVAELESSINVQTISTAADGTLVVTGEDGDTFGLLLGNSMTGELIAGIGANELMISGPESEILDGSQGTDITFIGVGSDTMIGGTGLTIMHAGTGASTLDASRSTSALLFGGSGDDTITGGLTSVIQTGNGSDSVTTVNGATSFISGGSGNDTFHVDWESTSTIIETGAGNDLILIDDGSVGSTVINLGSGNDTINVGTGDDTIVYTGSVSTDVIQFDSNFPSVVTAGKVLQFGAGVTAADITITRVGNDALIATGSGGGIEVQGWFGTTSTQIQTFELADGTTIPAASINVIQAVSSDGGSATSVANYHNTLTTTANDVNLEVAFGEIADIRTAGNGDVIQLDADSQSRVLVQTGTDTINLQFAGKTEIGTEVGATAVVNVGASLDVTVDAGMGGNAVISSDAAYGWGTAGLSIKMAAGINSSDVSYIRSGEDLLVDAGGGSVDIVDWFEFNPNVSHEIDFADGTVVDMSNLGGAVLQQTASNEQSVLVADGAYMNLLQGDSGSDTLQANSGASAQMYGGSGNDVFTAGAGSAVRIQAGTGTNTVTLDGSVASADFDAGSGNSTFSIVQNSQGAGGPIQIDAGSGTNDLTLGFDAVVFDYALNGGSETIRKAQYSSLSSTTLRFASGIQPADVTATASGNDLLLTFGSNAGSVLIKDWLTDPDSRLGQIAFDDGTIWSASEVPIHFNGSAEADTLSGVSNRNIFDGGGGPDIETSAGNADTFIYNAGYGVLEIDEHGTGSSGDANLLLMGAGITAKDIKVSLDSTGDHLLITDGISGDEVQLDSSQSAMNFGIASLQFADGTSLSGGELLQRAETLDGTTGHDTLNGTVHPDYFDGLGGGDIEVGGGGNDTFVFNEGYGQLEIDERDFSANATNVLMLGAGISEQSLTLGTSADYTSLVLGDGVAGDQITIANMLAGQYDGVQEVQFSDGTVLSLAQLVQRETSGTSGADTLVGTSYANIFDGHGGNDLEVGNGGQDTFVFDEGYGQLTIKEFDPSATPTNVLQLGTGIGKSSLFASIAPNGNDLILTDGVSGDQITLQNMVTNSPLWGVQYVQFADGETVTAAQLIALSHKISGTPGADTLNGTSGADLLDGRGGIDVVTGNGGNDTFVFDAGYGQLEISETELFGGSAVLQLGAGISVSSVKVTGLSNGNLLLMDGVTGDQITLDGMLSNGANGVQMVQFADGTLWSREQLMQIATTGTPGDDSIYGSSGAEVLDGKGGNDLAVGNGGNDTFVFDAGYGRLEINETPLFGGASVLQLGAGINASSMNVTSLSNGNVVITDGVSGDQVTIDALLSDGGYGVQQVQFADGSIWTREQLIQASMIGTSGNDNLNGTSGADLFDGKGGADVETGNGGNDTFVFNAGYGELEISEIYSALEQPVLQFGVGIAASAVTVTESGNDILLTDGVTGDKVTLDDMWTYGQHGIQEIVFADGTTWSHDQLIQKVTADTTQFNVLNGTSGADSLTGTSSADLFDGKGGSDVEAGNGGSDTFVFDPDYGQLTINEYYSGGQAPVLQLGAGISLSGLRVAIAPNSVDVVLTDGISGDQVTLQNMASVWGSYGVQQVRFADGTSLSAQQLIALGHDVTGTVGADTLSGTSGADLFDGKGGGDIETGSGGTDTFIFNQGYGHLEINEYFQSGGAPILQMGAGIDESSLTVRATADGMGLVLTDGVNGDQITLDDMLFSNGFGVEQVQFADGTALTAAQLVNMETTGTPGSDTLYGTSGAEVFDGKGGADAEIGNGGNDTYTLNPGYGPLTIENGFWANDTAAGTLEIASASPDQLWLKQVGNDLQIDVMGTQNEATVKGWFNQDYSQLASISVGAGAATETVDSQLNTLIQAMATYSAQNPGFDPTSTANSQITDSTLLATVQGAWHHPS